MIQQTARGRRARGDWSTGNRKGGIVPGVDRAFLLRQGPEPRGIIASGTFATEPAPGDSWRGAGSTNYARVVWDRFVSDDDLLPLAVIKGAVTTLDWDSLFASGVRLPEPGNEQLEQLWAVHLDDQSSSAVPSVASGKRRSQAWQSDPIKRRAVEDHGQRLLEEHYRQDGWSVEDCRRGHPYDAVARRRRQVRYLEAKGTETDGLTVSVTSGEVEFARSHPGKCVLGVVHGILFAADGTLDPASGELIIHDWDPDAGLLTPRSYDWQPPPARAVVPSTT
jgi:hypothetical protein